jgi:hypothetical protein
LSLLALSSAETGNPTKISTEERRKRAVVGRKKKERHTDRDRLTDRQKDRRERKVRGGESVSQ